MAVIAIDLGGTKISGAVFNTDGEILKKEITHTGTGHGKEIGCRILNIIQHLIAYADEEKIQVNAIGCCVPGAVNQDEGTVWAPNIPGWESFPLKKMISESLHNRNIEVKIDSDRACSILGEIWQGAAKGCRNAIFLAVGTGIGAGILADGKILRGSHDIAGAVGWLGLSKPFHKKYIPCGCFEYHASGEGLAKVASEYTGEFPGYQGSLTTIDPAGITARDVFDAWRSGDPLARLVIDEAVMYWGMAAANLVSIFNPEIIIFGGGIFGPATVLLDEIAQEAKKWAQPVSINQVRFEPSQLGGDAALTGSAYLALSKI